LPDSIVAFASFPPWKTSVETVNLGDFFVDCALLDPFRAFQQLLSHCLAALLRQLPGATQVRVPQPIFANVPKEASLVEETGLMYRLCDNELAPKEWFLQMKDKSAATRNQPVFWDADGY
jgi:hypothetical protein